MVKEKKEIAVETVFVLPRNQFYWSYQINEGAVHTESKETIFSFLKSFVQENQYSTLVNLISRLQPFLILVRDNKVIELQKKDTDISYLRKNIEDELSAIANSAHSFKKRETLDEKIEKVRDKVLKL